MFTLQTKKSILRALITKRKSPYYIQYYVNGVCNLKCKQCNIVETNSGVRELTLPEIEVLARNIREIGGAIVLLTGGEPFLRKDLGEIVRILKAQQLDVRLQTAGYARTSQLQECYAFGARDLNISLDSLLANKQDFINSVPSSWEKAISAIARTSQVFASGAAICSLGCVLSRFNFREVPALLDYASRIGWWLSLVPVHITNLQTPRGFQSFDEDFVFRAEDHAALQRVLDQVIDMKRRGYLLFDSEAFIRSSYEFLVSRSESWRHNGRCDSPDLYFAVRPNGDFTTCCDYVLDSPPNLADPDFARRYKSGEVHRFADPTVSNCGGCHYGSYPEATLSVRDPRAFWERLKLTVRTSGSQLPRLAEEDYASLVTRVIADHPEIYEHETEPVALGAKLSDWKDPNKRRLLVVQDGERRKLEQRTRTSSKHRH